MVGLALRQNPGRNPEGRQRASSARDDGASANRVQVLQGHYPARAFRKVSRFDCAFRLRRGRIVQMSSLVAKIRKWLGLDKKPVDAP